MSDWKSRAQKVADAPRTDWKSRAQRVDVEEESTASTAPSEMDPASAIAVKLMPFPAVTRRTSAAIDAGLTAGQQLLVRMGLMDAPPSNRVSDEIDRAPVRINGRVAVKGQYVPDSGRAPDPTFGQLYDQNYDRNLALEQQAQREYPGLSTAASITSAALTPLPKFGKLAEGAGILAKGANAAKQGAAAGAIFGAGSSDADLEKGEIGKLLFDTGVGGAAGGGLGGGLGLAGGAGSKLLSLMRDRAAKGAGDAVAAEEAIQKALAEKNISSAVGSFRSSIQSASRDLEVLENAARSLPRGNPQGDAARAYLNSAEGIALRERVAATKLTTAPERIAEMGEKKATLDALTAGKDASVSAQTAEALKNPVKKHVTPRLLTLGHRLLPPLMGAVGGAIGGAEGATAGFIGGGIMSLTQGLPGRIIKNAAQKPAVRKAFWDSVFKAAGVAQNAAMVSVLETAAQQGPQAFAVAASDLIKSGDDGAALMGAIFEDSQPKTTEERAKKFADLLKQKEE